MTKKINTTKLGIFILIGFCIAVLAVALFGSGKMFKHLNRYVIFFPDSIKGLSIGAPVRFRGIQLGTVVDMQAIFDKRDNQIILPVYIEIDRERIKNLGMPPSTTEEQQAMLLKSGIRAELVTESFVTGQRAIALDMKPETPVRLIGGDPSVPEISTIRSAIDEISDTIQNLPIEEIAQKIYKTLTTIEEAVNTPEFSKGLKAVGPTLTDANVVIAALSKDLPPLIGDLRTKVAAIDVEDISVQLEQSLKSIDSAAANIKALSAPGAPLDSNANRALIEIAAAAREMRQLAEMLRQRPEVLLTGKK